MPEEALSMRFFKALPGDMLAAKRDGPITRSLQIITGCEGLRAHAARRSVTICHACCASEKGG